MKHALARLLKPVLRVLTPASLQRHPLDPFAYVHPCSCAYVGGPTFCRTGERPPRGEDSPLMRPYFVAHERRVAEGRAAEARRRIRRGGLLVTVRGVDVGRVTGGVA
ncbi:hypothetical protein [Streptomyces sp. NPDC048142]|uniref:hypothetical protein n=1 Tax=Streptomyces sp. NPDC048142 TaxID=3365501 RepID=UPI00371D558F